jgi:hypothetical protein
MTAWSSVFEGRFCGVQPAQTFTALSSNPLFYLLYSENSWMTHAEKELINHTTLTIFEFLYTILLSLRYKTKLQFSNTEARTSWTASAFSLPMKKDCSIGSINNICQLLTLQKLCVRHIRNIRLHYLFSHIESLISLLPFFIHLNRREFQLFYTFIFKLFP